MYRLTNPAARRLMTSVVFLFLCASALAENAAIVPAPRTEDSWKARHQSMNDQVKKGDVDLLFIGDSITHGWEGAGKATWDKFYAKRKPVNLGIGGDRTQHVLWRLDNGNIDGIKPKLAILMIGTNNCGSNTAEEIAEGIAAIVQKLRTKLPDTKVLVLGVFPREETPGSLRAKVDAINGIIAKLADGKMIHYLNINEKFLLPGGNIAKDLLPDFVHPNEKGYVIWAETIESTVADLMGETKK